MTNGMIEWKQAKRGTYRATVNGIELDVWRLGTIGWRWNALRDGIYLGFKEPLESLDAACESAIEFAETHNEIS